MRGRAGTYSLGLSLHLSSTLALSVCSSSPSPSAYRTTGPPVDAPPSSLTWYANLFTGTKVERDRTHKGDTAVKSRVKNIRTAVFLEPIVEQLR